MKEKALEYLLQGVSVIPTGKTKAPAMPTWREYQDRLMTTEEVVRNFSSAIGIATIGGEISNGRTHIDFDTKYDLSGTLYIDFCTIINENDPSLIDKMVIVQTPSGGYHWIYNMSKDHLIQSKKLAQRLTTDDEKLHNPNEKVKVLIETKCIGGYCVAPPTDGYKFISERIQPIEITEQDQELILTVASMFHSVPLEEQKHPKKTESYKEDDFSENPFDAYNKSGSIESLLISHSWTRVNEKGDKTFFKRPGTSKTKTSGNYDSKLNRFSVFSESTEFETKRGYSPSAVFCKLECNDDWSLCAKKLIEKGFGRQRKFVSKKISTTINRLKEDGVSDDEIILEIRKENNISIEESKIELENFISNQGKSVKQFWDVIVDKNDKKKVVIKLNKFTRFISDNLSIYRFKVKNIDGDETGGIFRYVKVDKNIIREVKMSEIKDYITDYVSSLEFVFDGIYRDMLMEVIQTKAATLFSDTQMEFLDYINAEILQDDKDTAYYPFLNCLVKVTKDEVKKIDYSEVKGKLIWKDSLIKHDFDINDDINNFSFYRFIEKINADDIQRIEYFGSCIGYLLHGYKDPLNPICVVFGEEVADSSKGGGAGKGINATAIGKIMPCITLDGKGFKADKPFAFQRVGLDTKIILLQDTDKNFDFESLYSKLTDGLTIEKKNKDELFLNYDISPKFLITTNYSIPNVSTASKRRQRLVEFSPFFNETNTPADYLGEYLFVGWTKDQWDKFYSLMFMFVRMYLDRGILKVNESETSITKRIVTGFGDEFLYFFNELKQNTQYQFNELHQEFLKENDLLEKDYSKIRFSKAIETACSAHKYKLEKYKNSITKKTIISWT